MFSFSAAKGSVSQKGIGKEVTKNVKKSDKMVTKRDRNRKKEWPTLLRTPFCGTLNVFLFSRNWSPAKGGWQKSDRRIRKSDQKVTERVPKTKKSDRTPFADLLLRHPKFSFHKTSECAEKKNMNKYLPTIGPRTIPPKCLCLHPWRKYYGIDLPRNCTIETPWISQLIPRTFFCEMELWNPPITFQQNSS